MTRKPRPLIAVAPLPTLTADLDTIAERARELPLGVLNCREHRRHDWRSASVRRVGHSGYHRVERCTDCHSERWQELDGRGLVVRSGIHYSDGYLNPPGTGRVDQVGQGIYRLEALRRYVEGTEAAPKRRRTRKAAS